jgi:hypothetical protein
MKINEAAHGISVVIETEDKVYIGRFDRVDDERQCLIHDCTVHPIRSDEDPERFIRWIAKYGIPVDHRDFQFSAGNVKRVRVLGSIPKE